MRGMLEDVGPRLRTGQVVIARTVRVEGIGEGVIAAPLEALAKDNPDLSLGSYPSLVQAASVRIWWCAGVTRRRCPPRWRP